MNSNVRITGPDLKAKIQWDNVLDVVTDLTVGGIAAALGMAPTPDGIAGVVNKIRGSVKATEPIESQAWSLVALCFASAIDDLRPAVAKKEHLDAARWALDKTKTKIQEGEYFLTPEFFTNPVSLPLYRDLRADFVAALSELWPDGNQVGGKLDRAFNKALYSVIRHADDLFEPLRATVSGPGWEVHRLEDDWVAYRARLIHQYEVKPVFGQEDTHISLSQLYVPPRAIWHEKRKDEDEKEIIVRHLVDLHTDMQEWLANRSPQRCIRLIRGGPGSGKSSFTKALAATLAEDENWRALLIEMQRLKGTGSLEQKLEELLVEHEELFHVNPLGREYSDDGRPITLIFDGLDELAMPNSPGAQRIAEDFWDELDTLLATLNSATTVRAVALVTGRDAIIEAALTSRHGRKLPQTDALQIVGLQPVDKRNLEKTGPTDAGDYRREWWYRYAQATGSQPGPPPVLVGDQLGTLTDEPLLCYLLVLSGKAEESRHRKIDNINEIYQELIKHVWNRVWGEANSIPEGVSEEQQALYRQTGPIGAFRNQDEFEHLLEYVAVAAWRSGESRIATVVAFEETIRQTDAEEIWQRFQREFKAEAMEDSFSTLALTFFFRKQTVTDRGFEFTHRTFGEYLAARRLVREAETSAQTWKNAKSADALDDWLKLTGAAEMTEQIVTFLKDEMRLKSAEHLAVTKEGLTNAVQIVLRDGMRVRKGDYPDTGRAAETLQRNAEGALLACLSAASIAIINRDETVETPETVFSDDPYSARRMIQRLGITEGSTAVRYCLAGLNYVRMPLSYLELSLVDFSKAKLSGADLSGANLSGANLEGANLEGANLERANLERASLEGAGLEGANLEIANLEGVKLSGAKLSGTNLSRANLYGANLSGANLSGADLSGADLSGAQLSGANLSGANLSGANLSGAQLFGANLSGANLSGATLSGANLSINELFTNPFGNLYDYQYAKGLYRTNLSGADLSGADLSGAYLFGADLSRADLSGADLSGAYLSSDRLKGLASRKILVRPDRSRQDLEETNLEETNLKGANLKGANLKGANLYKAINLTQSQIKVADGSASTLLPRRLRRPRHWPNEDAAN